MKDKLTIMVEVNTLNTFKAYCEKFRVTQEGMLIKLMDSFIASTASGDSKVSAEARTLNSIPPRAPGGPLGR